MNTGKKSWTQVNAWHLLFFAPYGEEEKRMARVYKDENGDWVIDSKLLNMEKEYFEEGNIPIEEVKKLVEEKIVEYYQDEINYYKNLMEQFRGEIG